MEPTSIVAIIGAVFGGLGTILGASSCYWNYRSTKSSADEQVDFQQVTTTTNPSSGQTEELSIEIMPSAPEDSAVHVEKASKPPSGHHSKHTGTTTVVTSTTVKYVNKNTHQETTASGKSVGKNAQPGENHGGENVAGGGQLVSSLGVPSEFGQIIGDVLHQAMTSSPKGSPRTEPPIRKTPPPKAGPATQRDEDSEYPVNYERLRSDKVNQATLSASAPDVGLHSPTQQRSNFSPLGEKRGEIYNAGHREEGIVLYEGRHMDSLAKTRDKISSVADTRGYYSDGGKGKGVVLHEGRQKDFLAALSLSPLVDRREGYLSEGEGPSSQGLDEYAAELYLTAKHKRHSQLVEQSAIDEYNHRAEALKTSHGEVRDPVTPHYSSSDPASYGTSPQPSRSHATLASLNMGMQPQPSKSCPPIVVMTNTKFSAAIKPPELKFVGNKVLKGTSEKTPVNQKPLVNSEPAVTSIPPVLEQTIDVDKVTITITRTSSEEIRESGSSQGTRESASSQGTRESSSSMPDIDVAAVGEAADIS